MRLQLGLIGNLDKHISPKYMDHSVADSGGGANPPGGTITYDFAKFSPILRGIERILTLRGVRVQILLCRSATPTY